MFEDIREPLVLQDSTGANWLIRIYVDDITGERALYTSTTDIEGPRSINLSAIGKEFSLMITTDGRLITYPKDYMSMT